MDNFDNQSFDRQMETTQKVAKERLAIVVSVIYISLFTLIYRFAPLVDRTVLKGSLLLATFSLIIFTGWTIYDSLILYPALIRYSFASTENKGKAAEEYLKELVKNPTPSYWLVWVISEAFSIGLAALSLFYILVSVN